MVKRLQKRDIDILWTLYRYRALSTEQLMRHFCLTKPYAYKKTHVLRNSKLIISHPISGYNNSKRMQGSYHRISETGIACLRKQGYPVEREANELRVNSRLLPYLLSANDIMIDLAPYGWTMLDSREIKKKYELNRGGNIQGALISPEGVEYGFYIFKSSTSKKNLMKIIHEIKESAIQNFILFTKGQSSFDSIITEATKPGNELITGGALKILPYTFGKTYLQIFSQKNHLDNFITRYGITYIANKTHFNNRFDMVVLHEGKEKYLVNLLDTDLMKFHKINRYRKEAYEKDGRPVFVLTHMKEKHQNLLQNIRHIDYIEVSPLEIMSFKTELEGIISSEAQ